ncbi:MAG TPA: NUDIX domain-containing protein [Gammaproteobacteria bacterium]|nr:NUDIX domain-containing protein [Gammaproteobacteria bacterium]
MANNLSPITRPAARLIILDPDNRVLLLKASSAARETPFWVMPGGGVEPGESFEQAALREAREECGFEVRLGPCVWIRRHRYQGGNQSINQYERFFVAHAADPAYAPISPDSYVVDHRWWTLEAIQASDEIFAPRNLRKFLGPILEGDYPERPIDCGV